MVLVVYNVNFNYILHLAYSVNFIVAILLFFSELSKALSESHCKMGWFSIIYTVSQFTLGN